MVHEVVQIAFAWHGYHLHQFETACGSFGRPDDDGDWGFEEVGDESDVALAQVAAEEKAKFSGCSSGARLPGWTFGSLTCGYTYRVPGRWATRLGSGVAPSRVRIVRNVPVISRRFRTAC
jgi:hypothetical protein